MTDLTFDQWRERARHARRDWPAFIDGRTTGAVSGEDFAMVDPATGKAWARVASCGAADVRSGFRQSDMAGPASFVRPFHFTHNLSRHCDHITFAAQRFFPPIVMKLPPIWGK